MFNKSQLVRQTCAWAHSHSQHVKINHQKLVLLADKYVTPKGYDQDNFHLTSEVAETALLQVFMIDFMNFCFWSLQGFEYEHLAESVQHSIKQGITLKQILTISQQELIKNVFKGVKVPLADERARILREMARVMLNKFQGSFVRLIQIANKSAVALLNLLTENFDNFQDHMIYKGNQIHFYKRAQILIGDIYAKYKGKGLGQFTDIQQLTMYPDYRVPQVFDNQGVFEYSQELKKKIHNKQQITDRIYEVQIRASTIVAVQKMKQYLHKKGVNALSIQLDWFLWQRGEADLKNLPPHHRCLTIYY